MVEVKMPDGSTRELILPALTTMQIKELGEKMNQLRRICYAVRIFQDLSLDTCITINVFLGTILGSWILQLVNGNDVRKNILEDLGNDLFPRIMDAAKEVCGVNVNYLIVLNNITNYFNW